MIKLKILLLLCLVLQVSISKSQPAIPEVLEAKNISTSGFTADWEGVDGITVYSIDISRRNDFSTFPSGSVNGVDYDNLSNIYHIVEGASDTEIECKRFRIRGILL